MSPVLPLRVRTRLWPSKFDVRNLARKVLGLSTTRALGSHHITWNPSIQVCYIDGLPPEILYHILSHLSTQDLSHALCTSRWWRELAEDLIYNDLRILTSRQLRMLVEHDGERGIKRPTRNLTLYMPSCGGWPFTKAIVDGSRGLKWLTLISVDKDEGLIELLLSSELVGKSLKEPSTLSGILCTKLALGQKV